MPTRRMFALIRRLLAGTAVATVVAGGLTTLPASADLSVNAIVQGPSVAAAEAAVTSAGGSTLTELPLINGVLAQLPSMTAVSSLQSLGFPTNPDSAVAVDGLFQGGTSNPNPFPASTGATKLVGTGIDGAGVGVAVIDTGIDALPDFGSRLAGGVDYSGENNPFADNYGHGTFVAGLIAGNGASSNGKYVGEAPGANLFAVKVAGASGVTDVAKLIQGITWVVNNHSLYGIKVANLSLGSIPTGPTQLNPLDQAVEALWHSGVTAVVSAGNTGPSQGTITAPGDDPLVVTVGAINDAGTPSVNDDTDTTFSAVGPTSGNGWLKPDLVTSGKSVVSLRAPGSYIDRTYPSAEVGTSNFVGSGTSFSAAITSGAAALVLQTHPTAANDEVKARLLATATPGPTGNALVEGHGDLDAYDAANCPQVTLNQDYSSIPVPAAPGTVVSLGTTWLTSSWNAANYSANVATSSWNTSSWNTSNWNTSSWNTSSWNTSSWNTSSWNTSSWNTSSWNTSSWNTSSWNTSSWNTSSWN